MTREEAIRLIGWLKCTTNREDDLEAIDMAIEALQTDAEIFKWHLMSEDGFPPIRFKKYLVTTKNGIVGLAHFNGFVGEEYWSGSFRNCVVAWCDIPKPYKGGDTE